MTFVEALYAGIPVVTTNFGGAREVVTAQCGSLLEVTSSSGELAATFDAWLSDEGALAKVRRLGPLHARALCDPAGRLEALAGVIEGLPVP